MRQLVIAGCLQVAFLISSTAAQPTEIGVPAPVGWQGTGARYIAFDLNGFTVLEEDVHLGVLNSESHLMIDDDPTWASVDVLPWEMYGYVENDGGLLPEEGRRAGGFFRDEIYVASTSGDPLQVEYQFSLETLLGSLDAFTGESVAQFTLSMGYYPDGESTFANGTFRLLDFFNVEVTAEEQFVPGPPYLYRVVQEDWDQGIQDFSELDLVEDDYYYSDVVTLSTNGQDAGLEVASGTWLPISIGLWGNSHQSNIDWSNSFTVEEVVVLDAATGNLLAPFEYAAVSRNDNFPSNGEIPEPATLLLLLGAVGVVVMRRGRT